MDGSTFQAGTNEVAAGELGSAVPDLALSDLAVPVAIAAATRPGHARHWVSLVAAAAAHIAVLAALIAPPSDAIGDGGIALEAVAVSIVDAIPGTTAPISSPAEVSLSEPDADTTSAAPPPAPRATEHTPVIEEPAAPDTALDPAPDPAPAQEAALPPAQRPDVVPRKEQAPREPPPPDVVEREPPEQPAPPVVASPASAATPPSASSAEAAPGIVRAYASSVSKVLDRQKPRSRGVKGLVRIQFTVDAGGRPSAPLVLASSGSPRLDDMVIEAVSRMKFPAPPPQMSPRQRTFTVPFAFR